MDQKNESSEEESNFSSSLSELLDEQNAQK